MAREPQLAAGVGAAVASRGTNLAKRLEAAMVAATEKCAADGIVDPDKIKAHKLAAYDKEKAAAMNEANAKPRA